MIIKQFPNLSSDQIVQFEQLKPLYEDWNAKINVISRKDMNAFYVQHVLHSLAIAKVISFKEGTKILDVGTGGGFPVIPLAIMFPKAKFTAVDSIGKKIKVVKAIGSSIQLKNISAIHSRVEELDDQFDFIVSRAVTRTANFIPWMRNKKRFQSFNDLPNGFLFLKGGDLTEELAEVKGKFVQHSIADFFDQDFFETKKVVYHPF